MCFYGRSKLKKHPPVSTYLNLYWNSIFNLFSLQPAYKTTLIPELFLSLFDPE